MSHVRAASIRKIRGIFQLATDKPLFGKALKAQPEQALSTEGFELSEDERRAIVDIVKGLEHSPLTNPAQGKVDHLAATKRLWSKTAAQLP